MARLLVEAAFLDQPAVEDSFDGLTANQPGLFDGLVICTGNILDVIQVYGSCRTFLPLRSGCFRPSGFVEQLPVAAWSGLRFLLERGFFRAGIIRVLGRFGAQPVVGRRCRDGRCGCGDGRSGIACCGRLVGIARYLRGVLLGGCLAARMVGRLLRGHLVPVVLLLRGHLLPVVLLLRGLVMRGLSLAGLNLRPAGFFSGGCNRGGR